MSELIKGILLLAVLMTQIGCGKTASNHVTDVSCEEFFQNWVSECSYANCAWGEIDGVYTLDRWECEVGNRVWLTPTKTECLMTQEPIYRDWSEFEDYFGRADNGTCTLADWNGGES